jgi:hypothetical protein
MGYVDMLITNRTIMNLVPGDPKGKYDYEDYNRVGRAINEVANEIGGLGINAKVTWEAVDIPRASDITTYRGYVQTIVDVTGISNKLPTTNNDVLTITGANQIEQALVDAHNIVNRIMRWQDVNNLQETWDQLDAKQLTWGNYFIKPGWEAVE